MRRRRRQRWWCRQQNRCHSIGIPLYLCAHTAAQWVCVFLNIISSWLTTWHAVGALNRWLRSFALQCSGLCTLGAWALVRWNICLLNSPIQMPDKRNTTHSFTSFLFTILTHRIFLLTQNWSCHFFLFFVSFDCFFFTFLSSFLRCHSWFNATNEKKSE